MNTPHRTLRACIGMAAAILAGAVFAASADRSPITAPPRHYLSASQTAGQDSTLTIANDGSSPINSSVFIPSPAPPAGGVPPSPPGGSSGTGGGSPPAGLPVISNPILIVQTCQAAGTSLRMPHCGFAPASGRFTGVATWNGQSVPLSIACSGAGANGGGDVCTATKAYTIGGRLFTLSLEASGLFRGDYYCPPPKMGPVVCSAPAAGHVDF